MKAFAVACALFALFAYTSSFKLPQTFKRCKVSPELDNKPNECLRVAINDALRLIANEDNDLGVRGFDPFRVKQFVIKQGGNDGPIAVDLKFTDSDIIGLSKTKIRSVTGKLSKAKDFNMEIDFSVNEAAIKGPYSVKGKLLVFPLDGEGLSHFKLFNMTGTCTIMAQSNIKNGKEYLKISDFKLKFDPSKFEMNLSNLFNGNKAIEDNLNRIIKSNWKDLFNELKPSLYEVFSQMFGAYAKRILERIQYKNLFLTD